MEHSKNNKEQEKQTLFEDLVQQANQYSYGAHPSGRIPGSKKLTVLDLLRVNNQDDDKAPQVLPFQMNTFVEALGDVYVQLIEVQKMIASAYKSSVTKDTNKIKKTLVEINKNIQEQKQMVKKCGKLIDKIS